MNQRKVNPISHNPPILLFGDFLEWDSTPEDITDIYVMYRSIDMRPEEKEDLIMQSIQIPNPHLMTFAIDHLGQKPTPRHLEALIKMTSQYISYHHFDNNDLDIDIEEVLIPRMYELILHNLQPEDTLMYYDIFLEQVVDKFCTNTLEVLSGVYRCTPKFVQEVIMVFNETQF